MRTKCYVISKFDINQFTTEVSNTLSKYSDEDILNVQFETIRFGYDPKFFCYILVKEREYEMES